MTRLTEAQVRTFVAMPSAYRDALERHIEGSPPDRKATQQLFNAWVDRVKTADSIITADRITDQVITEAWETFDPNEARFRRQRAVALAQRARRAF